jgi:hypothetical protein
MPALENFAYTARTSPATSSLGSALAHAGVIAPHTGEPYTDAMLMGISGGAAFGYFTFAYSGHDPQANILTRNSFHSYGWDAICERLGLVQDVMHSTSPDAARKKLVEVLEQGAVPIVWADVFTLGYEVSELGEGMWAMQPLVVTAYAPDGEAEIADRAGAPIRVAAETLDAARAKVKKEKHRLVTVDLPEPPELAAAVRDAVGFCRELFTEKPPQGSAKNFGLRGMERWIERLTKPGAKESWAKLFPSGRALFAGLTTAFRYALLFWKDGSLTGDRALFADFLDEATTLDGVPDLIDSAARFRRSGALWRELDDRLLPTDIAPLARARELLVARHELFRESGNAKLERLYEIDAEFTELKERADHDLANADPGDLFEKVAEQLGAIRELEGETVAALREALET